MGRNPMKIEGWWDTDAVEMIRSLQSQLDKFEGVNEAQAEQLGQAYEEGARLQSRLDHFRSLFVRYGQHLPECHLEDELRAPFKDTVCTCGLGEPMAVVVEGQGHKQGFDDSQQRTLAILTATVVEVPESVVVRNDGELGVHPRVVEKLWHCDTSKCSCGTKDGIHLARCDAITSMIPDLGK